MSGQFKDLLNLILSQNPNLHPEELLTLVEKKKQESHGLLSDEGAIRLLAQQLSTTSVPVQGVGDQRIASLQAGLMDASISGEVASVGELSEFARQDGSVGSVLRVRLADGSGQVSCVMWDDVGVFFAQQRVSAGSRVRFEHGYTKYGRGGETEFHLGSRSNIQVLSEPPLASGLTGPIRVSSLPKALGALPAISFRMRKLQPARTEKGPVQALCEDETGLVIVKFWDETGEAASGIGEGRTVLVERAYTAERNGLIYVNVGRTSTVTRSDQPSTGSPSPAPIGSLNLDPVLRVISGKVVERSDVREIETREGRRARVSNIRVEDSSGRIRVSLWDKHAEFVESVRLGDLVELAGVRIRRGFMDELEGSTVFLSQIVKK
jgi:replication factor A1